MNNNVIHRLLFMTLVALFTFRGNLYSCEKRYIQTPEIFYDQRQELKAVFLAGSALYRWRDEFKQMMTDDDVILFDPINYEKRHPDRKVSLMWESNHIDKADILLVWIPTGVKSNLGTLSLTTLVELGRFIEMKDKRLIVGISKEHHLSEELMHQVSYLRPDATIVHSLEDLAHELRNSIRRRRGPD
jgi:Nucleoside 2-deoxyribosyltransferase like